MALTLFDMLNEICEYKSELNFDDPEVNKAYDIYMINRYLSMIEFLVPVVVCVNKPGMEKADHYNFLRNIIPTNRYKFNYLKKSIDDKNEIKIKCLCNFFEIGGREAKMYLTLLKPAQIEKLKKSFVYGKNGNSFSV